MISDLIWKHCYLMTSHQSVTLPLYMAVLAALSLCYYGRDRHYNELCHFLLHNLLLEEGRKHVAYDLFISCGVWMWINGWDCTCSDLACLAWSLLCLNVIGKVKVVIVAWWADCMRAQLMDSKNECAIGQWMTGVTYSSWHWRDRQLWKPFSTSFWM